MSRTTMDVGIDLGTTNSTIAVIDGVDARVIPNKNGSTVTPSAVWIDDRGRVRVGEEARMRALVDSKNARREFKLLMGRGDEARQQFEASGASMLPEELSAEVLKSLKIDFQSNTGEELPAAVITVPAAFENPATAATRKAAEIAGLTGSPLLLEPVAASLAYGFQTESENVYWLVYDFGGGTFDAAVMRIRDGLIQVVDHDGHNHLGGKNIDWEIVTKKVAPVLRESYDLPEFERGVPRWEEAFNSLKWEAEQAKIEVCRTRQPVEIHRDELCVDASGKPVEVSYELTPADVEEVSRPHIAASLHLCRSTLEGCGLQGSDMERILMVGGSTLNPWVREAVEAELGGAVEYGIDPVTVVARGAAIFAATQPRAAGSTTRKAGAWHIEIVHQPVGNVEDPDIGGRVDGPDDQSPEGYTIEFVDMKSGWRSGRVTLGDDGVFMTQLYAERQQRHEYRIELSDPTGTLMEVTPARVTYTLGVLPEPNPPAAQTLGFGMADDSVAVFVKKGTRLPSRVTQDHLMAVPLRAGVDEDEFRLPILEGDHARAVRNHWVGDFVLRGSDVARDLPMGTQIDVTVSMDVSQLLKVQVYIPMTDQDFDHEFDGISKHAPVDELRALVREQTDRLTEIKRKATRTGAVRAESVIARIVGEEMVEHVDELAARASRDTEAAHELDRRVRELAAAIDEAEDSVEWPELVEAAQEALESARKVVHAYGELTERTRLGDLEQGLERALELEDADLLRRKTSELDSLYFGVLDRQTVFHVRRFEWLADRVETMRDPEQARRLVTQGRRAIEVEDVGQLKATNRQLLSLLPQDETEAMKHRNIGDSILMH